MYCYITICSNKFTLMLARRVNKLSHTSAYILPGSHFHQILMTYIGVQTRPYVYVCAHCLDLFANFTFHQRIADICRYVCISAIRFRSFPTYVDTPIPLAMSNTMFYVALYQIPLITVTFSQKIKQSLKRNLLLHFVRTFILWTKSLNALATSAQIILVLVSLKVCSERRCHYEFSLLHVRRKFKLPDTLVC